MNSYTPTRSVLRFVFSMALSAAQTPQVREEIMAVSNFFEQQWFTEDMKAKQPQKPQEGQEDH